VCSDVCGNARSLQLILPPERQRHVIVLIVFIWRDVQRPCRLDVAAGGFKKKPRGGSPPPPRRLSLQNLMTLAAVLQDLFLNRREDRGLE
jgi:hypothetical protein